MLCLPPIQRAPSPMSPARGDGATKTDRSRTISGAAPGISVDAGQRLRVMPASSRIGPGGQHVVRRSAQRRAPQASNSATYFAAGPMTSELQVLDQARYRSIRRRDGFSALLRRGVVSGCLSPTLRISRLSVLFSAAHVSEPRTPIRSALHGTELIAHVPAHSGGKRTCQAVFDTIIVSLTRNMSATLIIAAASIGPQGARLRR